MLNIKLLDILYESKKLTPLESFYNKYHEVMKGKRLLLLILQAQVIEEELIILHET